ncbi:sphingomyelin phosphodiesterase 3, neutral membrane (neutral sphingomyelinase II), partial [Perkinsus chesapeaki]
MYVLGHIVAIITLISATAGFPPAGVVNLKASKKESDIVSMLTFNTWLIPVRARFPKFLDPNVHKRGKKIAKHVENLINTYDLDFVTLQEVWSPKDSAIATLINKLGGGRFFARKE